MRATLFNIAFYGFTALCVIAFIPLLMWPGRAPLQWGLTAWARGARAIMGVVGGMRVRVLGREHMPEGEACIVAGKHQSAADGVVQTALLPRIAFVAMKELGRYPFVGPLLRKLGMMLVDCGGGEDARAMVREKGRAAVAEGRPILIYPEGQIVPVGEKARYKTGVYELYRELSLPVVPVATDIGRLWPRHAFFKRAGEAVVEFLPAIPPGLGKEAFMARLEGVIEEACARLLRARAAAPSPAEARA